MVLIFLSWIYITFTASNMGVWFAKCFRIKTSDFVVTIFLGFVPTLLFSGFWAVFGRLNWEFHVFLLLLNGLLFWKFRKDIRLLYSDFLLQLKDLKKTQKVLLPIISLLIIAQCATAPFLPDNESYYIQTVKWLNEFGLVNGLANLHFFFGQTSGWHVLQSVFSFSFAYSGFNDLSGYCLLLGNVFAFLRLNDYFKKGKFIDLAVGLFPLANVLLFAFISAPSPDVAVYVLTFIIFYIAGNQGKQEITAHFSLLVIFVLLALLIKVTALPLILIPLVLLIHNYRILAPKLGWIAILSMAVLSLFLIKNAILSGYIFYPIVETGRLSFDYTVPQTIADSFGSASRASAFYLTESQYKGMNQWQVFMQWINLPKLDGLFNKILVLLVLFSPIAIYLKFNEKKIWTLYFTMLAASFLFYFTSPQYRFFLNYILFFSFLMLAIFFYQKKTIFSLLILSAAVTGILLFFPVGMERFTNNKLLSASQFQKEYLVFPHGNSKNPNGFEQQQKGNLKYFSPMNNDFFWGNGDGNLPCINTPQLHYFEKYYGFRPQLRGGNLKNGFYSQNTAP